MCSLMDRVFACADTAGCILSSLDHTSIVALSRACRAMRSAVHTSIHVQPLLLAAAARNAGRPLTKTTLMGWFALESTEADSLSRSVHARRRPGGRVYYLYRGDTFESAVAIVAGVWIERVRMRAWKYKVRVGAPEGSEPGLVGQPR